jgi:ubiquinone/menaquinone biosynthesis C-methylase UbiE
MLQKLRDKIQGTELEARMTLHRCEENKIGVPENVDFILAFYLLHEVPDQDGFLEEMATMLNPGGQVLIVEPPFRVSKTEFEETVRRALNAGLSVVGRPKVLFSKAALLKKG